MKNIKSLLILAVALMLVFTGCGNSKNENNEIESVTRGEEAVTDSSLKKETDNESSEASNVNHDVNLADIKDEIKETLGASDALDFNENSINILYGIDKEDIRQCAGFSVAQGTFPHEIIMVEASSKEAAERIDKAFETKITSFAEQSKNYDAENYALAKKCKVENNGSFYAMFLSPDYELIKGIYNKYIK